jgi:hypothetical protein
MLSTIWSGAGNATDVFFLIAAILAGLATILALVAPTRTHTVDGVAHTNDALAYGVALVPAAICLIALGLLAI